MLPLGSLLHACLLSFPVRRKLLSLLHSRGACAPTSFPVACGAHVPPEHTLGFLVAFAYLFIILCNVLITERLPHLKHMKAL